MTPHGSGLGASVAMGFGCDLDQGQRRPAEAELPRQTATIPATQGEERIQNIYLFSDPGVGALTDRSLTHPRS